MKYFNVDISLSQEASNILKNNNSSFENCKPIFKELVELSVALNCKLSVWIDIASITVYPQSRIDDIMEIYFLNKQIVALQDKINIIKV